MGLLPKCCICNSTTLTFSEAIGYGGDDDMSVFCEENGNRVCINCATKIHSLVEESITIPKSYHKTKYKKTIHKNIRWDVFKRDGFKCKICGSHIDLHCDHIYPESKGGATTFNNLQTLCARCNRVKGNKI